MPRHVLLSPSVSVVLAAVVLFSCEDAARSKAEPRQRIDVRTDALRPPLDLTADQAFGQVNLTQAGANFVDDVGMNAPEGIALDRSVSPPRLYLIDTANSRVLAWANAQNFTNARPADLVIGQVDAFVQRCNGGATTPSEDTLCNPRGAIVDSAGTLYVADTGNNRVLAYLSPFTTDRRADRVYGQASFASQAAPAVRSASTLQSPSALSLDAAGNLYVADSGNHRVLRYNAPLTDTVADVVLGQESFTGFGANRVDAAGLSSPRDVAVDRSVNPNRIYVADTANNRVLGWPNATSFANGAPATLVIGQADASGTLPNRGGSVSDRGLNNPMGISVDGAGNLYVADTNNSRVLRFDSPFSLDTVADAVFGQLSFTSSGCTSVSATSLCFPSDVAVSSGGHIAVSDTNNNRVVVYHGGMMADGTADRVFGQPGFTSNQSNFGGVSANSLSYPRGLAWTSTGGLYVADYSNSRVLYYAPSPADQTADIVFGQPDMMTGTIQSPSASTFFYYPSDVVVDAAGRLWVSDYYYTRIMGFTSPLTSQTSTILLGTTSYTSAGCGIASATCVGTFADVVGLDYTSGGSLFVADGANHRVLRFDTLTTNAPASAVLGQVDFAGSGANQVDASGLSNPLGVAVDTTVTPNLLYVSDTANNRVLRWSIASLVNGAAATLVLGQPTMWSSACGTVSATTMCGPRQPWAWNGSVLVPDANRNRLLRFDTVGGVMDGTADAVVGQGSFTVSACNQGLTAASAVTLCTPSAVTLDANANLYVADQGNHRALAYLSPFTTDVSADAVFGQGAFGPRGPNFIDRRGLTSPGAVALDTSVTPNRLYIADTGNNRVLGWADVTAYVGGAPATVVIGQPTPNEGFCNANTTPSAGTLCSPQGLAVDSAGRLWVADTSNNRVLGYDSPFSSDAIADFVIGQANFTSTASNRGTAVAATGLSQPIGLAFDAQGTLYVADASNNRVLAFQTPTTNGTASRVWGQPGFTTNTSNQGLSTPTASTLSSPTGVALDRRSPPRLYVTDRTNYRVLGYDNALTGDAAADVVIGQPDFNSRTQGYGVDRFPQGSGLTVSPDGHLYVADRFHYRVLEYLVPHATDLVADRAFGQLSLSSSSWGSPPTATGLTNAMGAVADAVGTLYVPDQFNNRVVVYFANNRPVAQGVTITPSNPTTTSTLTGSYTYFDADGDPESGTTRAWLKNGVVQPGLTGNTVAPSLTARGETWTFVVRPRDSIEFGAPVSSGPVTIANTPPTADGGVILPSGARTADNLTASYAYHDADNDPEGASDIRWFRNAIEQPALRGLRTVPSSNTAKGQLWQFVVTPTDGIGTGAPLQSAPLTIANTPPTASNPAISPANPRATDSLTATNGFHDVDGDLEAGSEIIWYRNGVRQTMWDNARTIPAPLTVNDSWYFQLRPRDGTDFGPQVTSPTVVIGSLAPSASNLAITPNPAFRNSALTRSYTYSDPDNEPEAGSETRWFLNGVEQPTLFNQATVPGSSVVKGQSWHFTIRPRDSGGAWGAVQTSAALVISNTAPVASSVTVSPAMPLSTQGLAVTYTYADADGDSENGTERRWFRNGVELATYFNQASVPASATVKGEQWQAEVRPRDGSTFGAAVRSNVVTIQNAPPTASMPTLTPAAPLATDTLVAGWAYSDPDGDAQQGSEVRWFRNGTEDTTLLNSPTVPPTRLVKGDTWRFTVRPRDGVAFGAVVNSPTVTVNNSPPAATGLAITPANPLAGQALTATYVYSDADGDMQMGSELRWFRDGVEQTAYFNQTSVPMGVTARGQRWSFSIRPRDGSAFGNVVTSAEVAVANTAPSASSPSISPQPARTADPLVANYTYSDVDGDPEGPSEIRWFRNGVEQPSLFGLKTVPAVNTTRGQSWYFTVRPSDGLDLGNQVSSAPVVIANTAPTATAVSLTPLSPRTTDALSANYTFGDADGDFEQGSELRWFKDGVEQTAYFNQRSVPAGVPRAGETWRFSIRPRDGVDFGPVVNSVNVVIGSSLPVASALAITPQQPISTDALNATYIYSDPDNEPESGSQIRWLRNGVVVASLNDQRTVPPGVARKGEAWSFTVRPGDGTGLGALQTSPSVTIGNSPPVSSNAGIVPGQPTTTDPLTASYGFVDPDGDPEASSEIRWFRNGLEVSTLADQRTVPASATAKGQVWYYRLRPGDGTALGSAEVSTPVFIANSAPVAAAGPDQQLQPTGPLTRVRLDGSASTDADGDVLAFTWRDAEGAVVGTGAQVSLDLPPGVHVFSLEVTDGAASASSSVTIDIESPPVTVTLPGDRLVPPGPVTVTPTIVDPVGRRFVATWTQTSGPLVPLPTDGGVTLSYFALPAGERVFELVLESGPISTPAQRIALTTQEVAPVAWLPSRVVVPVGARVEVDGRWSDDSNADALSWAWSSEGALLSLEDAAQPTLGFTAQADGTSALQLVVNDGTSDSAPARVEVIALDPAVTEHAPVAHAGDALVGAVGKPLALDGRRSYDIDGDALTYTWRSLSGPSLTWTRATTPQPTVRAASPGRAVIGLVVGDGKASSAEATVEVEFSDDAVNQRPLARVAAVAPATVGAVVELDGSRSSDPDGDAVTHAWTQVRGAPVFLDDATAARPRFVALRPGAVTFSLAVSDGTLRSSPVEVTVLVTTAPNRPPTAEAGPDQAVLIGSTVQLDGAASSDPDGDPLRFLWEQLQGPPVVLQGTPAQPSFTPRGLGRFVFRLTVFDGETPSLSDEVVVVVSTHGANNQRPVARVGPVQVLDVGATVTLDGTASSDPDPLDRLTYEWTFVSFPTGSEPTLLNPGTATPSFVAAAAGPYTVRLVVSDGSLSSEPAFADVVVGLPLSGGGCGCSSPGEPVAALVLLLGAWRLCRRRGAVALLTAVAVAAAPALAAKPKPKPAPKTKPVKKPVKPAETAADAPELQSSDTPTRPPMLTAPGSVPNPYLEEAREMFANFQLEGLLTKLEFALAVKGISPEQRVEVYRLMAFTHASFDELAKAEEAFVKLLEVKPDHQLQGASPKVRQAFTNAQRLYRERQAVKLSHAPPRPSEAERTTTVDVVAQAGGDRIGAMTLHYRAQGAEGGFSQVSMVQGEQSSWSAVMPNSFPGEAGRRTVEYFIRARDKAGALLSSIGEEEKPLTVEIDAVSYVGPPVYKQWWFWTIAGALVAGAATAVTVSQTVRPNATSPMGTLGVERLP